jgi:ADP-heptose:LPS heptosyltransferase
LVCCLDLVITVDTSVAHLAGALGCPTSILLPYTPDYRSVRSRRQPLVSERAAVSARPSPATTQACLTGCGKHCGYGRSCQARWRRRAAFAMRIW